MAYPVLSGYVGGEKGALNIVKSEVLLPTSRKCWREAQREIYEEHRQKELASLIY